MRIILVLLLALLARPALATTELFSVTWVIGPSLGCTGTDYWFSLATYPPGAGSVPAVPFTIRGIDQWTRFNSPGSYMMVGATPPNGDSIGRYVYGTEHPPTTWYPSGFGFAFNPATDELHVHYACPVNEIGNWFGIQIFYTVP